MCVHVVLPYVHAAGMHATSEIHHNVAYTTCMCSYAQCFNKITTNMNVLTKVACTPMYIQDSIPINSKYNIKLIVRASD